MKDKNKVMLAIGVIVILIILIILLIIKLVNKHITIPTLQSNTEHETKNTIQNNSVKEDINNIITNDIQNNVIQNNIIQNTIQNNSTNTDNSVKESNEQKAINIAKQNWGEDDNVSFTFDSIDSEGKYIVCVRDKKTTRALYWYTIDIETATVTIE